MSLLEDLKKSGNTSAEEILSKMMQSDNIELKTQIEAPLELTNLKVIETLLRDYNFTKSANVIHTFIDSYLKYMVSYKREGRKEIIDALKGLMEKETQKTFTQKLFGVKGEQK